MAYVLYANDKPDISNPGQDVIDDIRENIEALRDGIIMGKMPDWDLTTTIGGGSATEPDSIEWRYQGTGDLALRATVTWTSGNPTLIVYAFTTDRTQGTPTYDTILTQTLNYTSGNLTSTTWG